MKRFIAEFEEQNFTQIIFPHKESDWSEYLEEAEDNFIVIINAIIKYQKCFIICDDIARVKEKFSDNNNLFFIEYQTDDTWARDSSALSILNAKEERVLLDFSFTGWGGKFEAKKDNAMSQVIQHHYNSKMQQVDFILEGGCVESNGAELLLTTSKCMLNKNRNKDFSKEQITQKLKNEFGATDILYLNHGYLAGDDTDSHIDTLARFIDPKTIVYVALKDKEDEHYKELKLMESELKLFAKEYALKLIALPMTKAIYFQEERLPATYANFLFLNGAVLVPVYGVEEDTEALAIFNSLFKDREVIPIDCQTLIKQHGSLHCVTMNF
ncbi:MAG: agmatine deiminase family protein [Campylobacterota bacterium]|nr:agmatine deiminase family protein [Campylobacterota bacterium]